MRALPVLSAVLLLAFLTHTEPLGESIEELPAQEQPEAQDQDLAISFVGDKRAIQEASGLQERTICYCRCGSCRIRECCVGTCGMRYKLCCI